MRCQLMNPRNKKVPSMKISSDDIIEQKPTAPIGEFLHLQCAGDVMYVSGQLPIGEEGLIATGRVGDEVSEEEACDAARLCVLNGFRAVREKLGAQWRECVIVARHTVYVACGPKAVAIPKIANAASEEIFDVLSIEQKSARSAVGVWQLPANAPVEVEMTLHLVSENK